jgi:hypothetical protein
MRISNDFQFNPHPVTTGNPELFWGTSRPDGESTFDDKLPGTVYTAILTTNQQETWVKVKNGGLASDWVCLQGVICQRITKADFTDSGTTLTKAVNGTLPVGAYYEFAKVDEVVAFSGDTTATITISGGVDVTTDVDGYMTGTPSLFAITGTQALGVPSGVRTVTTAGIPVIVITSTADATNINALAELTVTLLYKI